MFRVTVLPTMFNVQMKLESTRKKLLDYVTSCVYLCHKVIICITKKLWNIMLKQFETKDQTHDSLFLRHHFLKNQTNPFKCTF